MRAGDIVINPNFATMNTAYILLGGNMGDRTARLQEAATRVAAKAGTIVRASSFYETAAWGKTDQPDFLNQVIILHTTLLPAALMAVLLNIETAMGRIRTEKNAPRVIDIDILFYNREVIDSPGLHIPHPQLQHRRFVLVPLNELSPGLVHPVLHQRVSELLLSCTDTLNVKKFYLL